jgi:TRAP-type C4-dicarboxylate transport system permease small subunit
MTFLERPFRALANVFGGVALVSLAFLMVAITLAATVRSLIDRPITGIFELSEIALVLIVFLGLGWTQMEHGHIRVDALVKLAPVPVARAMNAFSWAAAALALALLTWPSTLDAIHSFQIKEFRWGYIEFPIWWAKIALAIGLWFATAQMLLYSGLALLGRDQPSTPDPHTD